MASLPALTVEQALAAILADARALEGSERVSLMAAPGRVLAKPLAAKLTQPPFDASAMDGYAVRAADVAELPARLRVIGEAAAGHAFAGVLGAGEALRIFTGAPMAGGSDAIVIQENTSRDGDVVMVNEGRPDPEHVRPRGGDFAIGQVLLQAGRTLTARDVTLAAAMGYAALGVRRRPRVAILATGDELVMPGEPMRADQIVCSNPYGIAALVERSGGDPLFLGIARDTREDLTAAIARADLADILVTLGGASVGDHDLVGPVLGARGMALAFWKIAMRPGKPLMFGRLGPQYVLGLPGNPVSSLITARLFLVPLIGALLGRPPVTEAVQHARTTVPLAANGPRAHYMRATAQQTAAGTWQVTPVRSQDSSLLAPLVDADCLLVRPIGAAPVAVGGEVPILPLDV